MQASVFLKKFSSVQTPQIGLNQHLRSFSTTIGSPLPKLFNPQTGSSSRTCLKALPGIIAGFFGISLLSFTSFSSSSADSSSGLAIQDSNYPQSQRKTRYLLGDSYRRRIFFYYEKRLRLRSSPEKVFEYFASYCSPDGEVFMTPSDLMRAVIPVFPPSESNIIREGHLRGERRPLDLQCGPSRFFMLFDTDNDGLISFAEYIFFVTLLNIPETSFSAAFKMFDLDHNGEIEMEEFKKVMALMRSYIREGACQRNGKRHGMKTNKPVENGGLIEYFFGKGGNRSLQHEKFVQFLKDLQDELLLLEFAHYDHRSQGTISAKDFALSMVASADINRVSSFLDRVETLDQDPILRGTCITFEEFKAFAELRRRLETLSVAIFCYGKVNGSLNRKDLQRAASHVCGVDLTERVVDVIFHVFDANRDGNLSVEEFLHVLQAREFRTASSPLSPPWVLR